MEKQKRQTLNADKRKVIADIFQQHFEDNSKFKKTLDEAKETYNDLREQAKVKINDLVRFHQPQEDVDTIRAMKDKYGESGGDLYHDNCFYVQSDEPTIEEINLQPSPVLDQDQGPFGPASSTAHQQLPCSGPPGILKLLVQLFPTRKISCQLEARTVAPSGTRPLCPGSPDACCLPAGTLLSIFAFLPFYNLWLCFVGARHFVCSLLTFVPSRYTI